MKITLQTPLTALEQRAPVRYLTVGAGALSHDEWQIVWKVFDQLRGEMVEWEGQTYTFAEFYTTFVEHVYASEFLNALWDSENVERFGRHRQREIAATIRRTFVERGWYSSGGIYFLNSTRVRSGDFSR